MRVRPLPSPATFLLLLLAWADDGDAQSSLRPVYDEFASAAGVSSASDHISELSLGQLVTGIASHEGLTESVGITAASNSALVGVNERSQRGAAMTSLFVSPNPFHSWITIAYTISSEVLAATKVRVSIVDIAGRQVRLLREGPVSPGVYRVQWNARDDAGSMLRPGVYLCRMQIGQLFLSRRLIHIR